MKTTLLALTFLLGCRTEEAIRSDARDAAAQPIRYEGEKASGLELIPAPPGDVATLIRSMREQVKGRGRTFLVYIGARWCEPCQRFHQAAEAGQLDETFPKLSLLVFDFDEDAARLKRALFGPGYLPYFGVPDEAGHGTSVALAGSIKGEGAVDNITPRLQELAARAAGP